MFNQELPPDLVASDNQDDIMIYDAHSSDSFQEDHRRPPLFFVQDDDNPYVDNYPKENNLLPKSQGKSNQNVINQKDGNDNVNIIDMYLDNSNDPYMDNFNPKFFSLSALGLTNVSQLPLVDDFAFIVGNKEYHCNKFLASYLSPAITRLLLTDINADRFVIDIEDDDNFFESIISLIKGDIIQITDENVTFLILIAKILENDEMVESFSAHISSLHEGNAIETYLQRLKYNLDTTQIVEYIASNFTKFRFDSLIKLNPSQFAEIAGSESLRIKDEESFFRTLCDYIDENGQESRFLLGYVNLPCLNEEMIPLFLQMITPDSINGLIWDQICERLKLEVNLKPKKKKKVKIDPNIEMEKDKQFDGILSRLKNKSNIRKNVKITASSFKEDNMYILTDRSQEGYWSSYNLPNSWIKFYFKNKSIKLEEYSLETADLPPESGHMISWVLEASNDDQNWKTLDTQYNYCLHEGNKAASTFPCDKLGFYRYFRIKQCGLNDMGDDTMILKAVEFFGRVKNQ
ncbi:hypothetical protein M9Y10_022454 [Tritrichomonas musculus]|uniref:BTB domain-containing protein n=1 Tax=Tritrichomonas musculus TaxID=1915356 RepID=A0ABR2KSA9_9EUKA